MNYVICPFDGDFCQMKQDRFDEWKQFVFNNPCMVFQTSGNMFTDCPIKHTEERSETCNRYKRYLFIVDKVEQELAQQNGHTK